jgi:hypothetical protein
MERYPIKRFTPVLIEGTKIVGMEWTRDGEWVSRDDHMAVVGKLESEIERLTAESVPLLLRDDEQWKAAMSNAGTIKWQDEDDQT